MQTFKNKNVAIVGLSVEGLDSVKFFKSEGARIWCCDRRSQEELEPVMKDIQASVDGFSFGDTYLQDLDRFHYIVRSPGITLTLPQFRGKTITSATKLFFELCAAPIIGVTGTKGKGTTSTLISLMCKKDGKHAWLGGNVGTPLLSKVRFIKPGDVVILELSSFQLEDLTQSPHIAVVLKTTSDHLVNQDTLASNFHPTRNAYVSAKKSIVRFQTNHDIAILNADDPTSKSFASETPAHIIYFHKPVNHVAYMEDMRICSLSEIMLRGDHNLENIAAAASAAKAAGVSIEAIQFAAKTFPGLEHRLEKVRSVRGVLYYNDSFSTVPETAIAAIASFSEPIILIAGGSEKGSDFTELGTAIANGNVKTLIGIGLMKDRIIHAAKSAGYRGKIIDGLPSMHEIVKVAADEAETGDVVLLSPACASFDMFPNYKERGKQFKHEVSLL